jgi:hypothetical protein
MGTSKQKCHYTECEVAKKHQNRKRVENQGCQIVYFQTKNPNLGKLWNALEWERFVYFMVIWKILWPFVGIFCAHLVI